MPLTVSLIALAVALAALADSFRTRLLMSRRRVRIEISRSTCLDAEGKERVSWSISHEHPVTLLDRFRVARALRRFERLSRSDRENTCGGST